MSALALAKRGGTFEPKQSDREIEEHILAVREGPHEALGQQVSVGLYKPILGSMPDRLPAPRNTTAMRSCGQYRPRTYISFKRRSFRGERLAIKLTSDGTKHGDITSPPTESLPST
ncbi:hypothetical protein [Bradyrhizobium sp. USDA 10063]